MAKQLTGFITGTIENLCFYKMEGQYYVRMKSSLSRKRVKKSAAFKRTMESAGQLAAASVIASGVYRKMVKEKRKVDCYRKMVGMAKLLLQGGTDKEKITGQLSRYVATVVATPVTKNRKDIKINPVNRSIKLFKRVPRCALKTIYIPGSADRSFTKCRPERKVLYSKEQPEAP